MGAGGCEYFFDQSIDVSNIIIHSAMSDFSGGGSGFIKYHTSTVPAGEMVITAKVGASRSRSDTPSHPSIVTLPSTTITALAGHHGGIVRNHVRFSDAGGDGYSGGGGFNKSHGHNGGSNGGNGEGGSVYSGRRIPNHGGRGTGENVAAYVFDHFKLSPGQGGRYHKRTHTLWNPAYFGGGGGGVMVNGKGPTSHYVDKGLSFLPPKYHPTYPGQGKGYGGGGGTCDGPCGTIDGKQWSSDGFGQSGVILLEVV